MSRSLKPLGEIRIKFNLVITSILLLYTIYQLQRNTTPMYRAPEMIDLYSNMPITEKVDIWVSIKLPLVS